ncbi:hypothetical protein CDA63_00185 [Hymenobacter amundsenii]|uniref:Uncharacterized protein n=1 Tax=Hymenobacter amundsenii TaxID=2006685 RepID=A0A246FQ06_9BACT|nr:hypothetical protein [Hymenobacter amundsenii]OWP64817.1 hypothetical protein CDA63_00185 [Hymenobacter amundsenii]
MSFFSLSTSSAIQAIVQQTLTASSIEPVFESGGPPVPPLGAQRRSQEFKAQSHCRTHARSTPYASGKRW